MKKSGKNRGEERRGERGEDKIKERGDERKVLGEDERIGKEKKEEYSKGK